MKKWNNAPTMLLALLLLLGSLPARAQTPVWQDEFNTATINPDNWTYDFGDGCERNLCGWGNSELQYYTSRPENARIVNGNLVIEARRETFLTRSFTSARLKTEGRVHMKYGTLEARIKMPDLANGLWPALWMLGTSGVWPANGEIDIAELGVAAAVANGTANRLVGAAVHWSYNGSQADYGLSYLSSMNLSADYHLYKMTWDPSFIRVYIDNVEYFVFDISNIAANSLEEMHIPHFLILNLAVGGSYTGILNAAGITAPMPAQMLVDYVRLYQSSPGSQLYLGKNFAKVGTYGIFTETAAVNDRLIYGTDANMFLWNNLTAIAGATAYEGSQVWALRANAGAWFGMGVAHDYKNLSAFAANGYLRFYMKTSSAHPFRIGISTGHGDSWVSLAPGGNQYGLIRDGAWHEVSIPFTSFLNLDLYSVKQAFMLVADAPAATVDIHIDNIRYTGGGAANLAPTVSLTAPANGASFTAPASINITATAADTDGTISKVDFYNGNTLLGSDATSPYSYSWTNVPAGNYTISAVATDNGGLTTTSATRSVSVTASAPNLALNRPVTVSSTQSAALGGSLAVDGNATTRWSSAFADPQWIYVDLGANYNINRVKLSWEAAYGRNYLVQVSATGAANSWTTIKTITGNTSLVNDHTGLTGTGRYVRMYGTVRGTVYGYSLYELEVYGTAATVTSGPCSGTVANGDYRYQVSTSGSTVNWTFIPQAPIAGSTLCIIYIKTGTGAYAGYTMSASGSNFVFSQNHPAGTALSFYFTYRVGATMAERNSSATPHSYTAGTSCAAARSIAAVQPGNTITRSFDVFPNPADKTINLSGNGLEGGTLTLQNMYGAVVLQQPYAKQLDVAVLSAGRYHLVYTKGTTRHVKQLVIKH
jgi:beta-glucanase (GH16 family)